MLNGTILVGLDLHKDLSVFLPLLSFNSVSSGIRYSRG